MGKLVTEIFDNLNPTEPMQGLDLVLHVTEEWIPTYMNAQLIKPFEGAEITMCFFKCFKLFQHHWDIYGEEGPHQCYDC